MKKTIIFFLCLCFTLMPLASSAQEIVDVYLDGEIMEFEVPAQIIDDRTMVPMRAIFESLGASVEWIEEESMIFAIKNDKAITMSIDNNTMTVANLLTNEGHPITLDVAPMIVSDRTLVPARAVAESLDCTVEWNEAKQSVYITTK